MFIEFVPELDAQKPEIRAEAARLSILAIELAAPGKTSLKQVSYRCGRVDESHQSGNALSVQVATESLKLRGDEYGVGLIDLLCRIPPPRSSPTDGRMRCLDFIQCPRPFGQPLSIGM
jgi:hypothetical protein